MLLNTANLGVLFTAYSAAFKNAWDRTETDWEKVALLIPSATETTLYAFLGQFPKLREWLGDRAIKDMSTYNYSVTNKVFESTVAVPRPKIEDDQYGVFTPMMEEMGYAAKKHPDELVFGLLAAAASTLCYDGQYFLSASHPSGAARTATSNYDSVADSIGNLWFLLDTKRPLKPLIFQKRQEYRFQAFVQPNDEHVFKRNEFLYGVDARVNAGFGLWQQAYGSVGEINSTNLNAYIAAMMALKSDQDKPLGIRPNLLVCGPSRRAQARQLLETEILFEKVSRDATGTSSMMPAGSNPNYQQVDLLVTPYLT